MPAAENEAIRLSDVHYSVNDIAILKNITGTFPRGEITALVGPSGAGKTTLFWLCNGLKSPSSGEITVLGYDITDYDPVQLRQTVGLALQRAAMVPGSVRDNLALPFELQGETLAQQDAEQLMHDVGLDDVALDRDIKDLSGGQRQKLSIARTLAHQPDILLLDEVTSSLDHASRQTIEELIVKQNETHHTTIVWITHSLEQAKRVADFAWVMMDGELMETGTSVLSEPTDERVKRFVEGDAE